MPSVSSASDQRAALIAGFLGWTLDAFDFFLVIFCLTAIGHEFGKSDAEIALSVTVTLAFRPVGAFLFGLIADRYGRRLPLMIDLVFYSIVEVLTGFAPNYTVFLVLRALFGIGMGGEWGVGATLVMEKAPPRLRGLLSGFLQQGYALGYLLAEVILHFVRIFTEPAAAWVAQNEQIIPGIQTSVSPLKYAVPQILGFVVLLAVWYALLRWLYLEPSDNSSTRLTNP